MVCRHKSPRFPPRARLKDGKKLHQEWCKDCYFFLHLSTFECTKDIHFLLSICHSFLATISEPNRAFMGYSGTTPETEFSPPANRCEMIDFLVEEWCRILLQNSRCWWSPCHSAYRPDWPHVVAQRPLQ